MIRKIITALWGGPWIVLPGNQVKEGVTRFESSQTVKVGPSQRIQSIAIYNADGTSELRFRIMPLIPKLWEDFKAWVDFQWYWHRYEKKRRFRK